MKTLTVVIAAAVFAAGCNQNPDPRDAKITKLEARVSEMEARYQGLNDAFTNLLGVVQQMSVKDEHVLSQLQAIVLQQQDGLQRLVGEMHTLLTNQPSKQVAAPRYVPGQPQPVTRPGYGATRDGVPLAIYNEIAAEAARKFPANYDMQVFVIQDEIKAYRKLHP